MGISKNDFIVQYAKAASLAFHGWKPYEYQKKVFEDLFLTNKKFAMCEWARGSGKTQVAVAFLVLSALLYPKSCSIFIAPTEKDAKDIIRDKILNYVDTSLLEYGRPAMTTGEVTFKNGSVIYFRGAEGSQRGKDPVAVVYDEFRDFKEGFHQEFSPVLRRPECKLLVISTPPYLNEKYEAKADDYDQMVELCQKTDHYAYNKVTCWDGNPRLQDFYKQEELDKRLQDNYDFFRTEYLLERTRKKVRRAYLGDIDYSYLLPHSRVMSLLESNTAVEPVVCLDCSGLSRWGIIFAAVDRDRGQIYLVDCLVIKALGRTREDREQAGMSVSQMWPRVEAKCKVITGKPPEDWHVLWDSADTMLMDETNRQFGDHICIEPVHKKQGEKIKALTTIRDLCFNDRLIISERCKDLIDEFQSLEIDLKTEQPKSGFDDLTACLRYILMSYDYCLGNVKPEPLKEKDYFEKKAADYWNNKRDILTEQQPEDFLGGDLW